MHDPVSNHPVSSRQTSLAGFWALEVVAGVWMAQSNTDYAGPLVPVSETAPACQMAAERSACCIGAIRIEHYWKMLKLRLWAGKIGKKYLHCHFKDSFVDSTWFHYRFHYLPWMRWSDRGHEWWALRLRLLHWWGEGRLGSGSKQFKAVQSSFVRLPVCSHCMSLPCPLPLYCLVLTHKASRASYDLLSSSLGNLQTGQTYQASWVKMPLRINVYQRHGEDANSGPNLQTNHTDMIRWCVSMCLDVFPCWLSKLKAQSPHCICCISVASVSVWEPVSLVGP